MNFCCEMMEKHSKLDCNQCEDEFVCPDVLIHLDNEGVGIIVHDGGNSFVEIKFCPWCGKQIGDDHENI